MFHVHLLIDDSAILTKVPFSISGALKATSNSKFGHGNGNFLLDEVQCRGSEGSLEECEHRPWREHDCKKYEAAGVVCKTGGGKGKYGAGYH